MKGTKTIKVLLSLGLGMSVTSQFLNAPKESATLVAYACDTKQDCTQQLTDVQKKREQLESKLKSFESQKTPLKNQIETLISLLEVYQTELMLINGLKASLTQQQEILEKSISENQDRIKKRLLDNQLSWESNRLLNFVADSSSLGDLVDRLSAVESLTSADNELIKTVQKQKAQLQETMTQQEQRVKEIERLVSEAEELKKSKKAELEQYIQESANASSSDRELADRAIAALPDKLETRGSRTSQDVGKLIETAKKYLGIPYVWGGSTPSGFDCSGLTSYVYREAWGVNLGRVTTTQEHSGTRLPLDQAQPGDLLFWGSVGSTHHVAIYLGNQQYLHAPEPGKNICITNYRYTKPDFAVRIA